MKLLLALVAILVVNVPFGYWRSNTRTLSVPWIMAVHIPVPIAIGLRLSLLGWSWFLIPAFVADYAAGQYAGSAIRYQLSKSRRTPLTSWLIGDLARLLTGRHRTKA